MKKTEFPNSIEETQSLIDDLSNLVEWESDKEKRRELFLLIIELKEHLIKINKKQKKLQKYNIHEP